MKFNGNSRCQSLVVGSQGKVDFYDVERNHRRPSRCDSDVLYERMKREPLPGDQFTLSSGRIIVPHSKLPDGSWKAKYIENALKGIDEFVIIHPEELKK